MSGGFKELDFRRTPLGELSLRCRTEPKLGVEVIEVKLGQEFLMSSLFTDGEIALTRLALEVCSVEPLDVLVGGLGLGYTAYAALSDERVSSVSVVEAIEAVIDWHREGLLPLGTALSANARCRFINGDFFKLLDAPDGFDPDSPGRTFNAILVDIDHAPDNLLHPSHSRLYSEEGLAQLATHLKPKGVFALWSNEPPDPEFLTSLRTSFDSSVHVIEFYNPLQDSTASNTVYLASKRDP